MDGIAVNNLRVNKNYEDEPCSAQHLWTDPDCLDLPENFGNAIDLNALDDNDDKGKWQYTVDGDFIDLFGNLDPSNGPYSQDAFYRSELLKVDFEKST